MPERNKNILDEPILSLTNDDYLRLRDLVEGTLITGAPGSGKSSTSGKQLAKGLLRIPHCGGLVLTAKTEETANWIDYAKSCGREKDLIVFNAESGLCFDPLHYEFTRKGRGSGDLESIIDLFSTLLNIGKQDQHEGNDPFWARGAESLMRAAIKLLELAGERISIVNIDRVIRSLPSSPGQEDDPAWQAVSYTRTCIAGVEARYNALTPVQVSDLEFCVGFLFRRWPAFDDRPRSSLEMTWAGMADKFLYSPYNQVFSAGKCDFTPEDTMYNGRIVIADWPLLEYGHQTGTLIQVIIKLIFQRAWLRRKISESPNPCFLFQDEFQYFIVPKFDNFFQQTCRGSRIAVVCLTQNILNLSETLGERDPGSKTKSFLGNLGVKIFHQQNDTATCSYAADQIGREFRYVENFSASGQSDHASVGGSQQLVHLVEPIEFTRLVKPDSDNPFAQAVVYQSGKPFIATKTQRNPQGLNYVSVFFTRE
jgi:hypothetical protein